MRYQKKSLTSNFKLQNSHSGQAAIIAVLFFVSIMTAGALGFASFALGQAEIVKTNILGKQSFFVVEAGQEDALYRLQNGLNIGTEEVISILGSTATTSVVSEGTSKEVTSSGGVGEKVRSIRSSVATGDEVRFNYGVQVGEGGIRMENSSSIRGNLFSAGSVVSNNNNFLYGDVISAGLTGLVDGIHATGTVYAHTIQNSFVEKDAHYQTISGSTVSGTQHPGSEDISPQPLPISDEQIDEWKVVAEAGGVISSPCPYKIKEDATIGPIKINCNLEIEQDLILTLSGMVWVSGNVTIKNTAIVRIDSALGAASLAIIADNPSNQLTSSKIESNNSTEFEGSGVPGSYIMLLSQNKSAESGGSEKAIKVGNTARGELLIYAGHGEVELQNSIELREVTAYKVLIKNSAQVIYETGATSALFETGPGGGYDILDWREIE